MERWINTVDYTVVELVLFAAGCGLWVVAYIGTLHMIRTRRYVEIPAGAVVANVAWELVWGFFFVTNMGRLFVWGYRAWFFLDVFIAAALFRYGQKQLCDPGSARLFRAGAAFGIVGWAFALYYYVEQGYDTATGGNTGYILNVMMSALYVTLVMRRSTDPRDLSLLVAWAKGLGTGLITVFFVLAMPENRFLLTLAAATTVLDVTYVALLHRRRATAGSSAGATTPA